MGRAGGSWGDVHFGKGRRQVAEELAGLEMPMLSPQLATANSAAKADVNAAAEADVMAAAEADVMVAASAGAPVESRAAELTACIES